MKKKTIIKSHVLAMSLGWDTEDLSHYRYHAGHTSVPVYALEDEYLCIVRKGGKPAKNQLSDYQWKWKLKKDNFVESQGCELYTASTEIED